MASSNYGDGAISVSSGEDHLIRVSGRGFWSEEAVRDYLKQVRPIIARCRAQNRNIRLLVDVSNASVQSSIIADRISSGIRGFLEPGDRIAVVVSSTLAKMQSDRIGKGRENHRTFQSAKDAEAWLVG